MNVVYHVIPKLTSQKFNTSVLDAFLGIRMMALKI